MQTLIVLLSLLWTPAENVDGYRVYSTSSITDGWSLLEDIGMRQPGPDGYVQYETPDPDVLTIYQIRAYNAGGEAALEHLFAGWDPDIEVLPLPQWAPDSKLGGKK